MRVIGPRAEGPDDVPWVEIASWSAGDPLPWGRQSVVAVDVIRSTTTAITAVESGRRCFAAATVDDARGLARTLARPLLAGEVAGEHIAGFHVGNSPAAIATRRDVRRPLVLLSSSGSALMATAGRRRASALVACLRNVGATVSYLAHERRPVALLGAETRGEFRDEDRLCCAWIAAGLVEAGFRPAGMTQEIVDAWRDRDPAEIQFGASARYLAASGQADDLRFVLDHIDDVERAFAIRGREIVPVRTRTDGTQSLRFVTEATRGPDR